MVYWRVVAMVLVLLWAAVPALAAPTDPIMAPSEPPVALPWKIGQSVTYEVSDGKQTSTLSVRVVAEDACGFWVDYDIDGALYRACVGRPPNPKLQVIATLKDGLVTAIDAAPTKVDTLDMLYARWNARRGIPREDVTTRGGAFPAALKEVEAGGIRWSHPAVPLGGLVRMTIGTTTAVLVDYTLTGGISVIAADQRRLLFHAEQARSRTTSRLSRVWMAISFGNDALGTVDEAEWTESLGFGGGYRFSGSFALAIDWTATGYTPSPDNPDLFERLGRVCAGVRWFPLAAATGRWSPLTRPIYLQFDAGYAQLDRGMSGFNDSSSIVGRGVVGGARLGLSTGEKDWRLAMELHQHTAWLNAGEGVRVTYGITGIVELHF